MNARITMLGAPRGTGAFFPNFDETAEAASAGVCRVTGAPGTLAVHSPKPAATPPPINAPLLASSDCSPTAFLPALYVATPSCGAPIVYRGANRLSPVPAMRPILVVRPPRMQQPKRIGGRWVTRAARPVVAWPVYGTKGYA